MNMPTGDDANDDARLVRSGALWHSLGLNNQRLIADAFSAYARTDSFNMNKVLGEALRGSSFISVQPMINQLFQEGVTRPISTSALQQVLFSAMARSTSTAWVSMLASLDAFSVAAESSAEARSAVDSAAEELQARRPGVSRTAARKLVVIYAYVLGLAVLMTLSFIQPELMRLWLSMGGMNALKLSEAAGAAFDKVVPPPEPEEP